MFTKSLGIHSHFQCIAIIGSGWAGWTDNEANSAPGF